MKASRTHRPIAGMRAGALLSIAASCALPFPTPLPARDGAVPIIKDGMTQVVPEFNKPDTWIVRDLWVETEFDSDGDGKRDRMHVDVTRPPQTESEGLKLPVIYETSPYYAGTGSSDRKYFWSPRQELNAAPPPRTSMPPAPMNIRRPVISKSQVNRWVPHGYIVVHSSSPGTGLSQGCPTVGGDNESLAPKAVIDWLNGRARGFTAPEGGEPVLATWTTGKVGMTGTSYEGTLPLAAATTGVDGLEVIIPVAPNTSYYHYYRSNGLIRHPGGWMGEDIDVLYEFIQSNPDRREYCDCVVRDKEMAGGFDREDGDFNEFWARRDYLLDLGPMKAAMLMAHGFNDWNVMPEHSFRIYRAAKAKGLTAQVYYHQGGHGGEPPFEMMNRWFARYLHGAEGDFDRGPKAWIVRENDEAGRPTPYEDYPNPAASPVRMHLTRGARRAGGLVTVPVSGQGKETLVDNVSFSGSILAQAEWTDHRLIYATPVLNEAVHISGTPSITVRAACSKTAANLSVWLVALPWSEARRGKITDTIITRGWADLQNHRSLEESEPLVPGRFYEMTFDLQPDDQVIPAGKSIGLMVFSSDRDFTLWPEPGTELTLDLDATSLSLPVVGGAGAFRRAVICDARRPGRDAGGDIEPPRLALRSRSLSIPKTQSEPDGYIPGANPPRKTCLPWSFGEKDEDSVVGLGVVDWNNLYSIFKKNAGILAKVCDLEKEEKDISQNLSPEELAALQETQAEWVKAASQARLASKYPLLDSDLLPDLLKASLGGLLNLSEDQLETLLMESMGEPLSREALESATPLEAYARRLDLVDRLETILPEVLNDAQFKTWQDVEDRMISLFRGEPKYTRLGLDGEKGNILNLVTRAWREHYGFPKTMQGVLEEIAGDYTERIREVFRRHGNPHGHLRNLESPLQEKLEIEMLNLQLETEKGILEYLTQEQISKLVGKTPWLIQFELSTAITMRTGERIEF